MRIRGVGRVVALAVVFLLGIGLIVSQSHSTDVRGPAVHFNPPSGPGRAEMKLDDVKVVYERVELDNSSFDLEDRVLAEVEAELEKGPDWSPRQCNDGDNKPYKVYPIHFGACEQNIRAPSGQKHTGFALAIPGQAQGFEDELSYYAGYSESYYAITMKKAGWDCLRHYEILSSGTVPYLLDLEHLPPDTMRPFPRKILKALMTLPGVSVKWTVPKPGPEDAWCCDQVQSAVIDWSVFPIHRYRLLNQMLHEYVLRHMTTTAMAKNMLKATGLGNSRRVLMILDRLNCCTPNQPGYHLSVDYLDLQVLHGFKMFMGTSFDVYPIDPAFMYWNYPLQQTYELYGRGYSYSRRLSPHLRTPAISEAMMNRRMESKYYDVVIYGAQSWVERPQWQNVLKYYKDEPHRVFHLNGEDSMMHVTAKFDCSRLGDAKQYTTQYGHSYFMREL